MQKMILLSLLALFALTESAPPPFRGIFPERPDVPIDRPYYYGEPRFRHEEIKPFERDFRPFVVERRPLYWGFRDDRWVGRREDVPKYFHPIYVPYLGNLTNIRDYVRKVSSEGKLVQKTGEGGDNKIRLIGYPFYSRYTGYNPVVEIVDDRVPEKSVHTKPVHVEPVHVEPDHVTPDHVESEPVHVDTQTVPETEGKIAIAY